MHGHGVYPDFCVPGIWISKFDEILVDNVEEPVVVAGSQLIVTRDQLEVLITRTYAEAVAMALDHSEVVKPQKRLAAVVMVVSNETKSALSGPVFNLHEVTTTVHLATGRHHKSEAGEV